MEQFQKQNQGQGQGQGPGLGIDLGQDPVQDPVHILDQEWTKRCSTQWPWPWSRGMGTSFTSGSIVPILCMDVSRSDPRLHLAIARICLLMDYGLASKGLMVAGHPPRWVDLSACVSLTDYVKSILDALCMTCSNLSRALDILRFAKQSSSMTTDASATAVTYLVFDDGTHDLAAYSTADMPLLSWTAFVLSFGEIHGPDPWTLLLDHPRYRHLRGGHVDV